MKNYLIILGTAFVILFVFMAVIFNPYDKQYKSYYDENMANLAYSKNDINTFFKYMDKPATVKYHTGRMLVLSAVYKFSGRYDDALRVLNTFEKECDYSFCVVNQKPVSKIACRLAFGIPSNKKYFDKNEKISKVYYEKGDYKKAEEYNLKSEKINYCYNARIFAKSNEVEKARINLQKCSGTDKEIAKTNGIIALKEKKYAEAEREYLSMINKGCLKSPKCKGNNDVYMLLGELYFEQGNYSKALSYYKKVLKLEPYTYKANYYAAQCELKLNKKEEALKSLESVLTYNPDDKAEIESLITKIKDK